MNAAGMRTGPRGQPTRWRALAWSAIALAGFGGFGAQPAPRARAQTADPVTPRVEIASAPALRTGDVGAIEVRVELAAGEEWPLLVTPVVEGAAVEAVRGRLVRDDARHLGPGRLAFELPLLARSPGTALLRVEIRTYRCAATACEPVSLRASRWLRVERGPRSR